MNRDNLFCRKRVVSRDHTGTIINVIFLAVHTLSVIVCVLSSIKFLCSVSVCAFSNWRILVKIRYKFATLLPIILT